MDNRGVLLIVYGALLGYLACQWWECERRSIAWEAAEKAAEKLDFDRTLRESREPPPPPPTDTAPAA